MVRPTLNDLAYRAGRALPTAALKPLLGASLAGLHCALCLHRALPARRPTDWQEGLNMPPEEIDRLIELLLSARPGRASGWLTVTFDDGYADSAEYLRTRASRFPDVEFLFFICPEKVERQVGFRWDLTEVALREGKPREAAIALLDAPMTLEEENERADLRALAVHPDFRLATLDDVRELAGLPNVAIGNHTNLHTVSLQGPEALVREDYQRSAETLGRMVGPQRHFAFPFGTPRYHFNERHVALVRELGDFVIWTTENRPYRPEERRPRAVLPRFPINGFRSAAELGGMIATHAARFRLRGSRFRYDA